MRKRYSLPWASMFRLEVNNEPGGLTQNHTWSFCAYSCYFFCFRLFLERVLVMPEAKEDYPRVVKIWTKSEVSRDGKTVRFKLSDEYKRIIYDRLEKLSSKKR